MARENKCATYELAHPLPAGGDELPPGRDAGVCESLEEDELLCDICGVGVCVCLDAGDVGHGVGGRGGFIGADTEDGAEREVTTCA